MLHVQFEGFHLGSKLLEMLFSLQWLESSLITSKQPLQTFKRVLITSISVVSWDDGTENQFLQIPKRTAAAGSLQVAPHGVGLVCSDWPTASSPECLLWFKNFELEARDWMAGCLLPTSEGWNVLPLDRLYVLRCLLPCPACFMASSQFHLVEMYWCLLFRLFKFILPSLCWKQRSSTKPYIFCFV